MFSDTLYERLKNLSKGIGIKEIPHIFSSLISEVGDYLHLKPLYKNITLTVGRKEQLPAIKNIFNIGVTREITDDILFIKVNEDSHKYLPFILLREIYNLFVPEQLVDYESVQMVINQIIMTDLSKHKLVNEWRALIRENLEQSDSISFGFDRLSEFDRLARFFKLQEKRTSHTPTQFFFTYLQENVSLIHEKMEYFHDIFFSEYEEYFLHQMVDDMLIETIRCIAKIFYEVKEYKNLLSFKKTFQEFKDSGKLQTKLSLKKFSEYMDWIKTETFIAPNYQLNYKTINISVITFFFRFNPRLTKPQIQKFIDLFPFLVALKVAYNGFAVDTIGQLVIPNVYLHDLLKFIERLKNSGYLIKHQIFSIKYLNFYMNLNYFREYSQTQRIINPNHREYNEQFEIEFHTDYGKKNTTTELSILDFLILDQIRFYSSTGFGFERRADTLQTLKIELLNTITTQRAIIKTLKTTVKRLYSSNELKKDLIRIIENNQTSGFFYIKSFLEDVLLVVKKIEKVKTQHHTIKNIDQLRNFIETYSISPLIEVNTQLKNTELKKIVYGHLLPLLFQSRQNYDEMIERYTLFYDLFNSCYNLKLFNVQQLLEILEEEPLIEQIFQEKDKKFKEIYMNYKPYKITSKEVDGIIHGFLYTIPPIIQPKFIGTLPTTVHTEDFLELLLVDSPESKNVITTLKQYFPNLSILHSESYISNTNYIYLEIYVPYLTVREKALLLSILYNSFKENIIYGKPYFWSGKFEALTSRNFYDFDTRQFFYTEDLFEQLFRFTRTNFGGKLKYVEEESHKSKAILWSKEKNMANFVSTVNARVFQENTDFSITHLTKLLNFHLNLNTILQDTDKFKKYKQEYFFTNFIKSIKLIPTFQDFGFSQYFLYVHPTDISEVDFKVLLHNTFLKVKHPVCIEDSISMFIQYIIPYRVPNTIRYLHWLAKSKKIIREYCGFFVKKVYQILHFDYNLSPEGWRYDKDRFKIYVQNILFNPDYDVQIPKLRELGLTNVSSSSVYGPDSQEYKALTSIYNWNSLDVKSYLGTRQYSIINSIISLLKKNLIFPYLSLKNLDLHHKIYILLPNVDPKNNKTIIKIVSWFNYGYIYVIEGEYFIHGFSEEKLFENGLMIKLYLPRCDIHELIKIFKLLFEYLEIKDYCILNDLIDGSQLIESIYGGLDFLKEYNPLKNLKWNSKDKKWMNQKLFTQQFKPLYYDLVSQDNE
ncbi:MAG: hypothetical protein ACFFBC_00065 [Promethearchaeota archaeon]